MNTVLPVERAMTTGQAAAVWGVPILVVRAIAEFGLINAVWTPRGWFLDAEDVRRLAAEREGRLRSRATATVGAAGGE